MTTTDTNLNQLIINKLTQAQYDTITPNANELYLTTDGVIDGSDVISALGYTPYNSTNPDGYISGITGTMVNNALGYTAANNANLDGNWTSSASQVVSNVSLNYSSNYSIGLSSYLPNDNNLYEVTLTARATSGTATNNYAPIHITLSNYGADILVCYAKSYTTTANYGNGCLTFYAKSSTTMALKRSTDYRGTADIWFLGYRKVR